MLIRALSVHRHLRVGKGAPRADESNEQPNEWGGEGGGFRSARSASDPAMSACSRDMSAAFVRSAAKGMAGGHAWIAIAAKRLGPLR